MVLTTATIFFWLSRDAGDARAERVQTTTRTVLRAKPGEASRAITRLARGTTVTVLRRKGRWLRIRAGRKKGWITRTTVGAINAHKTAKRSDRWREHRRKRAGGWTKPTSDIPVGEGIRVARLERGSRAAPRATAASSATHTPGADTGDHVQAPRPHRKLRTRAIAELGFRSLGMDFSSNSQPGLGNYVIDTQAMATGIGGELAFDISGVARVAVDARYRLSHSSPGIHYVSSAGPAGDIPFDMHEADAGLALGARPTSKLGGVDLYARLGYSYSAFTTDDLDNVGHLPNESLSGMTIGAHLDLPYFRNRMAIHAGLDLLVAGHRAQTPGLEDGDDSEAGAVWATLAASHWLGGGFTLDARYLYQHAHTAWTGPSSRQADVMEAARTDVSHMLLVGLGRGF